MATKFNYQLDSLKEMFKALTINYINGTTDGAQVISFIEELIEKLPVLHPMYNYLEMALRLYKSQVIDIALLCDLLAGHVEILLEYNNLPKQQKS